MKNKKLLISGLAVMATAVVVGSGFAVWNFQTDDESSKGIYNFGLYVTPNVQTIGTVSTNNDYALVLDQGALPKLNSDQDLADNPDYYKRGIYVGKLNKTGDDASGKPIYETLPNGSYAYDQVSELSGFWIQEQTDAQSIVAENVNDMLFETKIKLKSDDLAQYVQVRSDDNLYEIVDDENDKDYVTYLYKWGLLSSVLKPNGSGYRLRNTYQEIFEKLTKISSTTQDMGLVTKITEWISDNTPNSEIVLGDDAVKTLLENDLFKTLNWTDDNFYLTSDSETDGVGLSLRSHKALKVYVVYNETDGEVNSINATSEEAERALSELEEEGEGYKISIGYFMYYKSGLTSVEDLKNITYFSNEKNDIATEEVTTSEVEIGTKTFEVKDCYYFKYTLNTTNYGATGLVEGEKTTKQYENARFVYYPFTKNEINNLENSDKKELWYDGDSLKKDVILNTDDNVEYIAKPTNSEQLKEMMNKFGAAPDGKQTVDLSKKYVIVEFGSEVTTVGTSVIDD